MTQQTARMIEDCAALLLDFDGPMARLLPAPRNAELADASRAPLLAAGLHLPGEIEATGDHVKVLRYTAASAPDLLAAVEHVVVDGEVSAAKVAQAVDGLADLLGCHGAKTLVVTNNAPESAAAFLARLGPAGEGVWVCGRPAGHPELMKPSPHLLLLAAATAGAEPAQCLFVGDHASDAHAAEAAGAAFLGFATDQRHATELRAAGTYQLITSWRDIPLS